jgi:hypothetical protein
MSKFKTAFLHALKVGLHIALAIFVLGLMDFLAKPTPQLSQFVSSLIHFGVPAGVINMAIAGILKYLQVYFPAPTDPFSPQ